MVTIDEKIKQAAEWIKNSKHTTVFTGSGISIESGIPTFRGQGGLWNKYDPKMLEISYFRSHPIESWDVIKEIFYDFFGKAKPNDAHLRIAELEEKGIVKAVVTQNIDNLHQEAGSKTVYEFHGTSGTLSCLVCSKMVKAENVNFDVMPPRCSCDGLLRPNFIFFGEGIPKQASMLSFYEAQVADVFLIIGTTGEVMPACQVPIHAKERGCKIIEINPEPSAFTIGTTDIHLAGKATEMMNRLTKEILA